MFRRPWWLAALAAGALVVLLLELVPQRPPAPAPFEPSHQLVERASAELDRDGSTWRITWPPADGGGLADAGQTKP